jgi:hypothetical protein
MRKSKLTSQHGTQKVKTHNSTTQKTEILIHFNNLLKYFVRFKYILDWSKLYWSL